jgi:ADP-ribose pyrophosphatase YjhB (NUDIX family)
MENLYSNKYLDIVLINPNYPFMKFKQAGVVTLPYDSEGFIYILKKHRPNVGTFYELPRGFVPSTESYEAGALRELLEETGLEALSAKNLGCIQPDTGVLSQSVQFYAINVGKSDKKEHYDAVDMESNGILRVTQSDIDKLIFSGQIVDGYTLSSLYLYSIAKREGKV